MATRRFGARPSNQLDNLEAVVDPTASDDSTLNYGVDSVWVNTLTNKSFICTDATEDNAVWEATDDHDAVTLTVAADVLLALTGQALDLDTQAANVVFAGPAAGGAVAPTFRALVAADMPAVYLKADGSVALTDDWAPGAYTIGNYDFTAKPMALYVVDANCSIAAVLTDIVMLFDDKDYIKYARGSDYWQYGINSVEVLHVGATFLRAAGYARIGSVAAPTNVTAGDATAVRIFCPTIYGSPTNASGGDLTLISTSHATKGDVVIGDGGAAHTGAQFVATINGGFRMRMAGSTRYRSDQNIDSSGLGINAFDDTGGVYLPIKFTGVNFVVDVTGNLKTAGYLRVGSVTAPTNTTAGDLNTARLFVGADAAITAGFIVDILGGLRSTGVRATVPSTVQVVVAASAILANAEVVQVSSGYSVLVLSYSPVAYWRMGEASGNLADSSGNSNTAVKHGAATYGVTGVITGDSDKAVSLNGNAANYFEAARSATDDTGDTFSIVAWVKKAADGVTQVICCRDNPGYNFLISPTNYLELQKTWASVIVNSTVTITGTGWHMVAVTKSGATVKFYIDGVDRTGGVTNATIYASATNPILIGKNPRDDSGPWNGSLDEIAIFNTALTAAQITALYAARTGDAALGSVPTIADGYPGQIVTVLNAGILGSVTLSDQGTLANSNLRLSATTIVLSPRDSIQLMFNSAIGDWVQIGQTNVL